MVILFAFFSCKNDQQRINPPGIDGFRKMAQQEIKAYHDSISFYIDTLLDNTGFSGGILVAKNGTIIYEHYQGYCDAARCHYISDTTPIHVASTSKTFTAHAIMQLMQQGKLKLTDTLQQFFPNFPYTGISIKHLLSHTSGLRNYAYFMDKDGLYTKGIATNNDVLNFIVKNRPALECPVGSKFFYSNTNFVLLALIVEKVSGKYFPDYIQENIFQPAGMKHSYVFCLRDTSKYFPSFGYRNQIYTLDYLDGVYGDKNVYTTCRDLLKYDEAIRDHILLNADSYEKTWQPLILDKHNFNGSEYYGLGWRIKIWPNGNKIVYHNGWWHGNNSVFQRLIQDTAVIIVTGNVFNRRIYEVTRLANFFRHYYQSKEEEPLLDTTLPGDASEKARKYYGKNRKQ